MASRMIVVLAFDGVQALDVAGPLEVFDEANRFSRGSPPYRTHCVAGAETVRASNGLRLAAEPCSAIVGRVDTLVLPGGEEAGMAGLLEDTAVRTWLEAKIRTARRVVSVCTGALLLARLGLLDGRRATTHWGAVKRLQQLAPLARVEPDAIHTRDGRVCTSAGVTAGIDLALALVEEDVGRDVAASIARNLVLYLRRPGGQSQFSAPLRAQLEGGDRLAAVVDHIVAAPGADLTVATLAERAHMSPRHFARAFKAATGASPARFVANSRLDAARFHLAETLEPLKRVAERCGFASADVLSRRFRDRFGVTPSAYRQTFGVIESDPADLTPAASARA